VVYIIGAMVYTFKKWDTPWGNLPDVQPVTIRRLMQLELKPFRLDFQFKSLEVILDLKTGFKKLKNGFKEMEIARQPVVAMPGRRPWRAIGST
jgi:hypothetical protein